MPETEDKSKKSRSRSVVGFDCSIILKEIGTRIKTERQHANMSQATLAKALGVEQNAVSQYENAQVDLSVCRLAHIAEILTVSVSDLLPLELIMPITRGNASKDTSHHFVVLMDVYYNLRAQGADFKILTRLHNEILDEVSRALAR